MRKATIFLLLFLFGCVRMPSVQKHILPIYYRFNGGQVGFKAFLSQSISFSDSTCCAIGNLISRISISPEGEINRIEILNSIDSVTDSELIRVLRLTKNHWKKCDTTNRDTEFYIQTVICTNDYIPNNYNPSFEQYKRLFIEPIFIVRYDENHQSAFVKNEAILNQMNSFLEVGKYEESLPLVNELIRRDPFNRDLYKVRIMINYNLERQEQVLKDDDRLLNFAYGISLDDLLRDKEM